MENLMEKALEITEKSEIPERYKPLVIELLKSFGFDWLTELEKCTERLGAGNTGVSISAFDFTDSGETEALSQAVNDLNEVIAKYIEIHGEPQESPLDGVSNFVDIVEFFDWEDEIYTDLDFKRLILQEWRELRIDYLRSIKRLKMPDAREGADKEIESIDIGLPSEACHTCGVIFFDNLDKHFGIRNLYCSITCETNATVSCVQCSTEYKVGKGVARLRIMRLEGFCSEDCLNSFKDDRENDSRYISSMRRKSEHFGVRFDPSITRRELYSRANRICAICSQETNFEKQDEYDPLLATVDHIVPWSRGGEHTWTNVQLCCLRCNIVKGNRD